MRFLLTAIVGISTAACTVGGIGDDSVPGDDGTPGDDTPPPTPEVALAFAPDAPCAPAGTGATCQGTLASSYTFTIAATASGGFAGAVDLAVTGLPASWTSAFAPAAYINLPVDGTGSATLTVTVPSYGDAGAIPLSVTATSSLRVEAFAVATTILNEYTARVTGGCDLPGDAAGPRAAEPGAPNNPLRLKLGATFKITNATNHQVTIHSDNGAVGFDHQPDPGMGPGGTYTVMPNDVTANYEWYCHDPDLGQVSLMRLIN